MKPPGGYITRVFNGERTFLSPALLQVDPQVDGHRRTWRVRQTIHDPEGHHDWVVDAVVDLDASDEAGELVLATEAMRRL